MGKKNEKWIDFYIFCTSFRFCHLFRIGSSSSAASQDTCWTAGSAPRYKHRLVQSCKRSPNKNDLNQNCTNLEQLKQNSTFDDVYTNISVWLGNSIHRLLACLDHLGTMSVNTANKVITWRHCPSSFVWRIWKWSTFKLHVLSSCLPGFHGH